MEREDEKLFAVFSALTELAAQVPDIALDGFPRFAIFGVESAGKTTLLEALSGIPVGYTAPNTATRCPVEYHFQRCDTLAEQHHSVYFNHEVEKKIFKDLVEVKQEVGRRMQEIGQGGQLAGTHFTCVSGFTEQILRVKITHPKARNMVIMDTPGLKIGSAQVNRETGELSRDVDTRVTAIVASVVRDNSYHLILCTEWERSDHFSLEPTYRRLLFEEMPGIAQRPRQAPPRGELRKADRLTVVFNKFDLIAEPRHLLEIRDGIAKNKERLDSFEITPFCTVLKPMSPYTNEYARTSNAASQGGPMIPLNDELRYLEEIEAEEMRWKKTMEDDHNADFTIMQKNFGLAQLRSAIDNMWRMAVRQRANDFLLELEREVAENEDKLQEAVTMVSELEGSSKGLETTIQNVVMEYCGVLQDLLQLAPRARPLAPRETIAEFPAGYHNLAEHESHHHLRSDFIDEVRQREWFNWYRFAAFPDLLTAHAARTAHTSSLPSSTPTNGMNPRVPQTQRGDLSDTESIQDVASKTPSKGLLKNALRSVKFGKKSKSKGGNEEFDDQSNHPAGDGLSEHTSVTFQSDLAENEEKASETPAAAGPPARKLSVQMKQQASSRELLVTVESTWKLILGDYYPKFTSEKKFGRQSFERIVDAYAAAVLRILTVSPVSKSAISEARNVIGAQDVPLGLKRAHGDLIHKIWGGEEGVKSAILRVFYRMHDPIAEYIRHSVVFSELLNKASQAILERLEVGVQTFVGERLKDVFKNFEKLVSAAKEGWNPRYLAPMLMQVRNIDFSHYFCQPEGPMEMNAVDTDPIIKQKREALHLMHTGFLSTKPTHGNYSNGQLATPALPFSDVDIALGGLAWLPSSLSDETMAAMAKNAARLSATNLIAQFRMLMETHCFNYVARDSTMFRFIWKGFTDESSGGTSALFTIVSDIKNLNNLPFWVESKTKLTRRKELIQECHGKISSILREFALAGPL